MKKITIISLVCFGLYLQNCQAQTKTEFEDFLTNFPKHSIDFLDSLGKQAIIKDTISPVYLNKFIWKKSKGIGVRQPFIYKGNLMEDDDFLGTVYNDSWTGRTRFDTTGCKVEVRTYPLAQIPFPNGIIGILYSSFDIEMYRVNLHVFSQDGTQISAMAVYFSEYDYDCKKGYPNLFKERWEVIYSKVIAKNIFLLTNKWTSQYINELMQERQWKIKIQKNGMLEVIWEKIIWEDGRIALWSKKGYVISDADGYSNLRENPSKISNILEKLPNGSELEILDASKEWWKVKTIQGKIGYVNQSRIKERE